MAFIHQSEHFSLWPWNLNSVGRIQFVEGDGFWGFHKTNHGRCSNSSAGVGNPSSESDHVRNRKKDKSSFISGFRMFLVNNAINDWITKIKVASCQFCPESFFPPQILPLIRSKRSSFLMVRSRNELFWPASVGFRGIFISSPLHKRLFFLNNWMAHS